MLYLWDYKAYYKTLHHLHWSVLKTLFETGFDYYVSQRLWIAVGHSHTKQRSHNKGCFWDICLLGTWIGKRQRIQSCDVMLTFWLVSEVNHSLASERAADIYPRAELSISSGVFPPLSPRPSLPILVYLNFVHACMCGCVCVGVRTCVSAGVCVHVCMMERREYVLLKWLNWRKQNRMVDSGRISKGKNVEHTHSLEVTHTHSLEKKKVTHIVWK